MNTLRIAEAQASRSQQNNPGESEVDRLFNDFGAALAQFAREKTTDFLSTRGEPGPIVAAGRPVLNVVTGHEVLEVFSTALLLAPQRPMTAELYAFIVRHQAEFTQNVQRMFPEDPDEERTLAELVRALRASLHPTPRR